MRYLALVCMFILTGCATQSALEPPVVDKRGVDMNKYAQDESECIQRGQGGFVVGAPITACMRERGYTILVPKS
jgi:hypothetical protein